MKYIVTYWDHAMRMNRDCKVESTSLTQARETFSRKNGAPVVSVVAQRGRPSRKVYLGA